MAVGVPKEDVKSATTGELVIDAGAVNVIYGSSTGLSATSQIKNQFWTQDSPSVQDSSEANDVFGFSLATGDFNGDGRDDLAIGAAGEDGDIAGSENFGAVNVIYGSSTGLSATAQLPNKSLTQDFANVQDS